ncbi:MAG: hemolysin family protein [Ruminococcus sp.]|nr:hemolysin family protein [Ruminococcus sp.]
MDSDGSHIFSIIFAVLALVFIRAFYACCEAAFDDLGDARVKSFENETGGCGIVFRLKSRDSALTAAFSAHRIINAALIMFLLEKPVYLRINGAAADMGIPLHGTYPYILGAAAAALIAALISEIFGRSFPLRLLRCGDTEKFAVDFAWTAGLLYIVMRPFTAVTEFVSSCLAAAFGAEGADLADKVTEEEILMMVDAGNETGSIESSERDMINNVFEFHELTVSDVMTHRTDISAVSIDAEISEAVYTAINSGFSRIPVFSGSIDHIEGIIYVKDLLCLIGTHTSEGMSVKSFMRDVEYVPESCMCDELLKKLTARRIQLAVAVDEYGGTAGLVTMEDLLEAIVGNIMDEYDNETEEIAKISDDTYIISGTADPSEVEEALGISFTGEGEETRYDTMSGFMTDMLGRIPVDGEMPEVSCPCADFTVLVAEDMRIVRIKAVIKKENKEKELKKDEENKIQEH